MQFFKSILAISALASVALADNTVTYVNQDSTNRTMVFSPSVGCDEIEPFCVGPYESVVQTFPLGWIGNFFAIETGNPFTPGMLGEITFNGWAGITFFDVSAIIDPTDTNGVKQIFPKNSNEPMAGCQEFPCGNAYYVPTDNLATKSTTETDFVCTIGTLETQRRRGAIAEERLKRVAPLTGEPQL